MKINQKTSVLFWLYKAKKTVEGLVPVYCRITIHGQRAGLSIGKMIHPSDWKAKPGEAKGSQPYAIELNRELNKIRTDILRLYDSPARIYPG